MYFDGTKWGNGWLGQTWPFSMQGYWTKKNGVWWGLKYRRMKKKCLLKTNSDPNTKMNLKVIIHKSNKSEYILGLKNTPKRNEYKAFKKKQKHISSYRPRAVIQIPIGKITSVSIEKYPKHMILSQPNKPVTRTDKILHIARRHSCSKQSIQVPGRNHYLGVWQVLKNNCSVKLILTY